MFGDDDVRRLFWVLAVISGAAIAALALAVTASIGASVGAMAHDWYAPQCCNGQDCRPSEGVRETPRGFVLPDGRVVPLSLRRRSLDGRWHVCDNGETVLCVYAPDPGV